MIEPQFKWAQAFAEGLAAVAVGDQYGYIDSVGRLAIKPQFETARSFSGGLAAVQSGEHWSYIDKSGQVVIRGAFNDAEDFNGGLARVHEGGKLIITTDGPIFWRGGVWTYINAKGEKVRRYRTDDD